MKTNINRTLQLPITCGDKTCASEPGKFCRFLQATKFGQNHFCLIWHETDGRGKPLPIEEKDGWLQRRSECLTHEERSEASSDPHTQLSVGGATTGRLKSDSPNQSAGPEYKGSS